MVVLQRNTHGKSIFREALQYFVFPSTENYNSQEPVMNDKNIDSGRSFDFGKTAQAYSLYRDIYPDELYNKLRERGVAADGTSWLDLGTGTGVLPSNLYNPKARITGVDISQEQISFARSASSASITILIFGSVPLALKNILPLSPSSSLIR